MKSLPLLKMKSVAKSALTLASIAAFSLASVHATMADSNPISTNLKVATAGVQGAYDLTATARPGDLIAFQLFLDNQSGSVATAPKISDVLDSHLVYKAGSSSLREKRNNADVDVNINDSDIAKNGNTLTWTLDDMNSTHDAAVYLYFEARLTSADQFNIGSQVINNVAHTSFNSYAADTNNVAITVNRSADQVVSFSAVQKVKNTNGNNVYYDHQLGNVAPGDKLNYEIVVTNTGNTASDASTVIKDILPAGVTYAGNMKLYNTQNPNGQALDGDSIVKNGYALGTVTNGTAAQETVTFDATVNSNLTGTQDLVNQAQVYYQNALKAQDNTTLIFSTTKGLIIQKDILDPSDQQFKDTIGKVYAGNILTYRINVQNNGSTTVTNPIVYDILPSNVTYVANSMTIDNEVMNSDVQNAFFNGHNMLITNLTPGLGKQIVFQVKVNECTVSDVTLTNNGYAKADSVALISDTATATLAACSTATPTPTPTVMPTTTPTVVPTSTPAPSTGTSLPRTGPEAALAIPALSGLGLTIARRLARQKSLAQKLRNIDII